MKMVQIRSLVRRHLIMLLQNDLDGDKLRRGLMAEVWNQCENNDDHVDAARRETEEILEWLRSREEQLREESEP